MTSDEYLARRERCLDELMVGGVIAPKAARRFLSTLIDRCSSEGDGLQLICVPIARRLVAYRGWRKHLTVNNLIAFCKPRLEICRTLRAMEASDDVDPEMEYLTGLVWVVFDKCRV